MALPTTKIGPPSPRTPSNVDYQRSDEKEDSEYQVRWSKVMDKGPYNSSSTYLKVEALLLHWAENCDDLSTGDEVNRLKTVLENKFNYNCRIHLIDRTLQQRLQVQVNFAVAAFVRDHDGPNTLLIVYYAGHGKPGELFGDLQFFGKSTPNDIKTEDDIKKEVDFIVWNRTEDLLKSAEADVLEIFDCCYAGTLGLVRGPHRMFEYLAAAGPMGTTQRPGESSFTSALIYALETLLEERPGGPFTTVDIMGKIKECPKFPSDQEPKLSNRIGDSSAGRVMLHPLKGQHSDVQPSIQAPTSTPSSALTSSDLQHRHTMTLHFDLKERPKQHDVEKFGGDLNEILAQSSRVLGVDCVRWGGMRSHQCTAAGVLNRWQASLKRPRGLSDTWVSGGLLSPSPTTPLSQGIHPTSPAPQDLSPKPDLLVAKGESEFEATLPPLLTDQGDDSEGPISDRRKKQRLGVDVGSSNVTGSPQGSRSEDENGS